MKQLNRITAAMALDEDVPPSQIIEHVMHRGMQVKLPRALPAFEVRCYTCGGAQGFFIPHLSTWSCKNRECIFINSGLFEKQPIQEKKVLPITKFGVPESLSEAKLSICNQSFEILGFLNKFAKDPQGFVLFAGQSGRGKTFAACATLHEYAQTGSNARFINVADLYVTWLECKRIQDNELNLLDKFCDVDFLVLDDMGTRTPTESFLDVLYILIDRRNRRKCGTIITTNLTSALMREKFGDAIFSRIAEGAKIFKFEGEDRRKFVEF